MVIISFILNGIKFGVPVSEIERVIHVKKGEERKEDVSFYSFIGISPPEKYISFEIKGVENNVRFLTGSEKSGMHEGIELKMLKPSQWFPSFYIGVWEDYLIVDIYEFMSYAQRSNI